jgi:hypothetical protein
MYLEVLLKYQTNQIILFNIDQVFFSQWFQPHETIHLSKVVSDVEVIALDTLKTLLQKFPDHPIFRRSELGQPKGRNQNNSIAFSSMQCAQLGNK